MLNILFWLVSTYVVIACGAALLTASDYINDMRFLMENTEHLQDKEFRYVVNQIVEIGKPAIFSFVFVGFFGAHVKGWLTEPVFKFRAAWRGESTLHATRYIKIIIGMKKSGIYERYKDKL